MRTRAPIRTLTVGLGIPPSRLRGISSGVRGLYRRFGLSPKPRTGCFQLSLRVYAPSRNKPQADSTCSQVVVRLPMLKRRTLRPSSAVRVNMT